MILLRLISLPYLRKHLLRTALTVAGIALGVAVFVGMHTANGSVLDAFQNTVDRIAGATELQVFAGETGFDEAVLERVQALPEVRVAVPVIEAAVSTGLAGQGNLLILGVDMTGDRTLRTYDFESGDEEVVDDPLVFLAQPDSLIVTREFAARNGLTVGSGIPLYTMAGEKRFTIRGIMRQGGLAGAFGGNLAVMDVYAAQAVFGRGRKFDRIDLAAREGISIDRCQAAVQKALGPAFQVERPSGRGRQFESIVRTYSMLVNLTSLFALLIGMFIIYNAFAIAVTERRSEIGILRALGASRGQVRMLFLGESLLAGLAGSAAGLGLGAGIAHGASGYIGSLVEGVYGVAGRVAETALRPWLVIAGMAIGVATSMVAAWIPARSAARVDPVQALQKGRGQVLSAGENRARSAAAAVLALAAAACLLAGRPSAFFYPGYVAALLAALLLTPALALRLARALRPLLKRLRPVEGALAADSLMQAPRRTSATVAALMLSLAMAVSMGGIASSSYASILDWTETSLNPDLFVTSSDDLMKRAFRFPAAMAEELARIEGVDEVQSVRSARVVYRGTPITLVAAESAKLMARAPQRLIAGDRPTMHRLTAAGKGLIISEGLAGLQRLAPGDIVEIPAPNGLLRLPVAGVVRDFSDQQGSVLIDRAVYQRLWKDDSVNTFRVYLKPGAAADAVKTRILERFSSQTRLFVLTNRDVREYIIRLTDQWLGMTYAQVAIAVLVAILGIVNTLTVSITDRRRELGVLKAVGGLRSQVRRAVWMEAFAIGAIGLILGLALGAVNLYYSLEMSRRDFVGYRMDYQFPSGLAALLVPVILGAAFFAALGPAESAVRGSLVEALEYE